MPSEPQQLILVVDDHELVHEALRGLLDRPGRRVDAATSIPQTLDYLRFRKPDLIVLDSVLPDTHGPRALGLLHAAVPEARIVYLGSHDDPAYADQALELGATAYLPKELAGDGLTEIVDELLDEHRAAGMAASC